MYALDIKSIIQVQNLAAWRKFDIHDKYFPDSYKRHEYPRTTSFDMLSH